MRVCVCGGGGGVVQGDNYEHEHMNIDVLIRHDQNCTMSLNSMFGTIHKDYNCITITYTCETSQNLSLAFSFRVR